MAHHKSAKKRIIRNQKRFDINRDRRSRVRTFIKKVETAIAAGDSDAARAAFKACEPELMRGAQKGAFSRGMASRKVSRLAAQVKALSA